MKGVLYIVLGILLVAQMVTRISSMDNTIAKNNSIKEKCFLKQTRFKPVSSYVKKVKKVHIGPVSLDTSGHSQNLDGDDLGHDDKLENSHEDSMSEVAYSFRFYSADRQLYSSIDREYNLFFQYTIPPPEFS